MAKSVSLSTYSDPFLVKQGAVWVLRHTENDLCSAPLIAGELAFYPDELAEAYPTALLPQAEIDAIIAALTPPPPPRRHLHSSTLAPDPPSSMLKPGYLETLTKLHHSSGFLTADLREAHANAPESEPALEIVLYGLLERSAALHNDLNRLLQPYLQMGRNAQDARRTQPTSPVIAAAPADVATGADSGTERSTTAPPRTEAEIETLVAKWRDDPCWDLETAEGFEAHVDQLRAIRLQHEAEWKAQRQRRLEKKAEAIGVPGNVELARCIESLEHRLQTLEGQDR